MLIQFVNDRKKEIPWTFTQLDEAVGRPSLIWLGNQLDLFLFLEDVSIYVPGILKE